MTQYLTQAVLAARWRLSPRTLERWRWVGQGPQFIKVGVRVRYRLEDIEAFEQQQLRQCTSDRRPGDMLMLPFRRRQPSHRGPRPQPSRPHLTDIELCAWLAAAEPGDRLEYHRGFLGVDRFPLISNLAEPDRKLLSQLSAQALQLADQDLVHLVQERLGPDHFSYIAIARRKPNSRQSISNLLLEEAA